MGNFLQRTPAKGYTPICPVAEEPHKREKKSLLMGEGDQNTIEQKGFMARAGESGANESIVFTYALDGPAFEHWRCTVGGDFKVPEKEG